LEPLGEPPRQSKALDRARSSTADSAAPTDAGASSIVMSWRGAAVIPRWAVRGVRIVDLTGGVQVRMNRDEAHRMLIESLLDHVREDPYPSRDQLDMIEESLTPEMLDDYLEVLADKAAQQRFPSRELLERMQRVARHAPPPMVVEQATD
jgi:hypothetical protein